MTLTRDSAPDCSFGCAHGYMDISVNIPVIQIWDATLMFEYIFGTWLCLSQYFNINTFDVTLSGFLAPDCVFFCVEKSNLLPIVILQSPDLSFNDKVLMYSISLSLISSSFHLKLNIFWDYFKTPPRWWYMQCWCFHLPAKPRQCHLLSICSNKITMRQASLSEKPYNKCYLDCSLWKY